MNNFKIIIARLISILVFALATLSAVISYAGGHHFDSFTHPAAFFMRTGFWFNAIQFISVLIYLKKSNKFTWLIIRISSTIYYSYIGISIFKFWRADQLNSLEIGICSFYTLSTLLIIYLTKYKRKKADNI